MAGVYREQGFEAVSKWLFSVFRSHVEDTYQIVRKVRSLPPASVAVPQPRCSSDNSIGYGLIDQLVARGSSNNPRRNLRVSVTNLKPVRIVGIGVNIRSCIRLSVLVY